MAGVPCDYADIILPSLCTRLGKGQQVTTERGHEVHFGALPAKKYNLAVRSTLPEEEITTGELADEFVRDGWLDGWLDVWLDVWLDEMAKAGRRNLPMQSGQIAGFWAL
jgi:hypothetical protein